MVAVEMDAEGFDDEVMVFSLGEAGDGDAADDSCACDVDGEGSTVGSEVGIGEGVFLRDGGVVLLEV